MGIVTDYEPIPKYSDLTRKWLLINANLVYNASNELIRWYERNFGICTPVPMDGNIYVDSSCTEPLFKTPVAPRPSSGGYNEFIAVPDRNFVYGIWFGKVSSDYDARALVVFNSDIDAVLIYNLSDSAEISVYHQTGRWPNYRTNGNYDSSSSPPVVTLAPGKYVIFYSSDEPGYDETRWWGFTDQEPIVSDTEPENYVALYDGSSYRYVYGRLKVNRIINLQNLFVAESVNGARIVIGPYSMIFRMQIRNSKNGDSINIYSHPYNLPKVPTTVRLYNIYDYDPPTGYTWAGGIYPSSIVYIEGSEYYGIISRTVKHSTDVFNPRIIVLYGTIYSTPDSSTIKGFMILGHKIMVDDAKAYGCSNNVPTPGFQIGNFADPDTFEYYNGSEWTMPNIGNGSVQCQNGVAAGAEIYDMINNNIRYHIRVVLRRRNVYGNPVAKVGSLRWDTTPPMGWNGVFSDYSGGDIPNGAYVLEIAYFIIKTDNTEPIIEVESYEDSEIFPYLLGLPYSISVSVNESGSNLEITVSTDAPDGKNVYVVDRDTGDIVSTGTVSGGTAIITIPKPSVTKHYRVYVEGDDLVLG